VLDDERGMVEQEQVTVETREQWRAWLSEHAATSPGVWLVTWKKTSPHPTLAYDDLVEEALCFGWVDSLPRSLDDERTQLRVTPRKKGSNWSRPNKERVERLTAAGLMTPAGRAVVEAAKADGSWSALDDVENLVEPDDLRTALDAHPEARRQWDGFPRSARRGILEWIGNAKRPQTRADRIRTTVTEAARGVRANQWRQPGARSRRPASSNQEQP
jgi:uncharacterized protein YdeI (YjbR/CyaY-like superfamily)